MSAPTRSDGSPGRAVALHASPIAARGYTGLTTRDTLEERLLRFDDLSDEVASYAAAESTTVSRPDARIPS